MTPPPACVQCGRALVEKRRDALYCSDRCRARARREGQRARVLAILQTMTETDKAAAIRRELGL